MTARSRRTSEPKRGATQTRRPLGQLAVEAGLITNEQLASAIADIQSSGKKLGEVLVGRGLMDESHLAQLLELQESGGAVPRLGSQQAGGGAADEKEAGAPRARADAAAEETKPSKHARLPGEAGRHAEQIVAAVRRELVGMLVEVEQRSAAAAELTARNAELRERLTEVSAVAQAQERELGVVRREVQRLTQLLEQREVREAALRTTVERLTRQLTAAAA